MTATDYDALIERLRIAWARSNDRAVRERIQRTAEGMKKKRQALLDNVG